MGPVSMFLLAPLALTILAGSMAPAQGGARPGTVSWDPPPCPEAAAAHPGLAWYRLDPVLDGTGSLVARHLVIGTDGSTEQAVDLAPESFASGPVDGLVLNGEDDGSASRLRLIEVARGCAVVVGESRDVVRSAVLAPGASHLFEHRVDRATRADLGIWRREIGGGTRRVLEGLDPDPVLGPTFVTDLILEDDGRLVVSSCAQAACRVRVLDTQGGEAALVEGTGPALGLTGDTLVARAACHGDPCPVDAIDLGSGQRRRLATDAFAAALGGPDRTALVIEIAGRRVVTVDVRTGDRTRAVATGGIPFRRGSTAPAGAETARGSLALAAAGRPTAGALETFAPTTLPLPTSPEVAR